MIPEQPKRIQDDEEIIFDFNAPNIMSRLKKFLRNLTSSDFFEKKNTLFAQRMVDAAEIVRGYKKLRKRLKTAEKGDQKNPGSLKKSYPGRIANSELERRAKQLRAREKAFRNEMPQSAWSASAKDFYTGFPFFPFTRIFPQLFFLGAHTCCFPPSSLFF
jgi:hypothetical protein